MKTSILTKSHWIRTSVLEYRVWSRGVPPKLRPPANGPSGGCAAHWGRPHSLLAAELLSRCIGDQKKKGAGPP